MNKKYIYGGLLEYVDLLNIARWLSGLCKIGRVLSRGNPVSKMWIDQTSFAAQRFHKEIFIPGHTEEELQEIQEAAKLTESMSEEELEDYMNEKSKELHAMLEAGELDIWDDTPQFVPNVEAKKFIQESLEWFNAKYIPACDPTKSFLERIVPQAIKAIAEEDYTQMGQYRALLNFWDRGKMYYEGEPPYKIKFSKQVADTLGIDPVMESIKASTLGRLPKRERNISLKYYTITQKAFPEFRAILDTNNALVDQWVQESEQLDSNLY